MKREISCKWGEFIENVEDAVLSIFHRDAPYWIALWVVRLSICQYFSYVERYINGEHHQKCVRTTNFHAGTIDVFNKKFAPARLSGSFTDPSLPQGYAPFGINNINGKLYVTYTKQNAQKNCRLTHKFAKTGRYASEEECRLKPSVAVSEPECGLSFKVRIQVLAR